MVSQLTELLTVTPEKLEWYNRLAVLVSPHNGFEWDAEAIERLNSAIVELNCKETLE